MSLAKGEKILKVLPVNDWDNAGILTKQGWMLLFPSDEVRAMGKTAGGVKAIELQEGDQVANMFLHQWEPFILIHSQKKGKLITLEDLKIWRRARKGQVVMTGNDALEGGISIIEGAIRIRFTNGELKTLHSNDISLDEPETPLYDMVNQPIESIYRPREEKTENLQYKEEKKKSDENSQTGGLFEKSTEEVEDSEDTIESGSNDATENSD